LLDEFGHPILRLGAGPNEVPHGLSSRQVFLIHTQPFVSFRHHLNVRTSTRGLGLFDRLIEDLIAGAITFDRDCAANTCHHIE
jgi:hypothetical protein